MMVGVDVWPRAAVVSPQGKRIAILTVDSGRHLASLRYGDPTWTSVHDVYSLDLGDDPEHLTVVNYVNENFGWSPESRWLVYSKQHKVYIFDTQTQSARFIADGSDPGWSPDGRFIAYRSVERRLVIYSVNDGSARVVSGNIDVRGFPRWSPDSDLVLFTRFSAKKLAMRPFYHDSTDFVALRISDGEIGVALDAGNGSDNRRFFWIKTGVPQ